MQKYSHRKNNVVPWKNSQSSWMENSLLSRFVNKESDLSKGMHIKESNLSVGIWFGKQKRTGV